MIATTKRSRRTEAELVAELEARIAALKARAEEKKAAKDPALKQVKAALKALDKALGLARDPKLREALGEARSSVAACQGLAGVVVPAGSGGPRRSAVTGSIDENALLSYLRGNPGQRAEQISAAIGTDSKSMRPVMKRLIEAGKVRTRGERRATTYAAL